MWLNKKLKKNDENDRILKRLGKKIEGKNTSAASWKENIKKMRGLLHSAIYLFIHLFLLHHSFTSNCRSGYCMDCCKSL